MKALRLIRQLRFQLQVEMLAIPDCEELKSTERALGIYENIIIQRGLEERELGMKVQDAFNHFLQIARSVHAGDEPPRMLPATSRAPLPAQAARQAVAGKARSAPEARYFAAAR